MKKKTVFIRSKLSNPPNDTQRKWLYDQIYKSISSEKTTTTKKVVVKCYGNIYALQEDTEHQTLMFFPEKA